MDPIKFFLDKNVSIKYIITNILVIITKILSKIH